MSIKIRCFIVNDFFKPYNINSMSFDGAIQSFIQQVLILYKQSMYTRDNPFSQVSKLQKELKLLQHQLSDKALQIQLKDIKIKELQEFISESNQRQQRLEEQRGDNQEGQSEKESLQKVDQLTKTLNTMLQEREEIDIGLQQAIEKEEELNRLRQALESKQESIFRLCESVGALERKTESQHEEMMQMQMTLECLQRDRNRLLEEAEAKKRESAVLGVNQQNLRVLKQNNVIMQNIIIQNEKAKMEDLAKIEYLEESKEANDLFLKDIVAEKEKMKKIINNYDWKLFCIETELELSNKEKVYFREENEKKNFKMLQYESEASELRAKVNSLQEELKLISDENNFFEMQVSQKQMKIEELQVEAENLRMEANSLKIEVDNLKDMQQHNGLKELHYRIKEKDDELKEITSFLKEKINENHQMKIKLEANLNEILRKKEKVQFENYYLQQRFTQYEQSMQKQSDQIESTNKQIDQLSHKLNDQSLLTVLRVQEFQIKIQELQSTLNDKDIALKDKEITLKDKDNALKDKQGKINELLAQRASFIKKIECLNQQFSSIKEQAKQLQEKVKELTKSEKFLETEINHLNMLLNTKNKDFEKVVRKLEHSQLNIKGKDKTIMIQQNEIKAAKVQLKELKFVNQRYQEELEQIQQIMAVSDEKLKILKKQAVGNLENEVNYQYELEQTKKNVILLQSERQMLLVSQKNQQEANKRFKAEIKQLRTMATAKLQEIIDYFSKSQEEDEETTQFQILGEDESFQAPLSPEERQKSDITKKMTDYCAEVDAICLKYE